MLGPVGANIIQPHHWGNNAAAPTRDAKAVHELNVIMQWHFVRFFLAPLGFCKPTDGLGIAIDVFTIKHRSEEPTYELQSLMRISYAVFCLKKIHTNH